MVEPVSVHLAPAGGDRTVRVYTPAAHGTTDRRFRFDVIEDGEHHEAAREARLGDVLALLYGR